MERFAWNLKAAKLVAVFNRNMPESTMAAWYADLADLDSLDVGRAIDTLCRTSERHPSLAQVIAESRREKFRRLAAEPTLTYDPNELPEGVVAIVDSENYQPCAVTSDGWGGDSWPADLAIKRVKGDRRVVDRVRRTA